MPRVKNLSTGLEHLVPPGHFSLNDPEYKILPERERQAAPKAAAEKPKPEPKKRK